MKNSTNPFNKEFWAELEAIQNKTKKIVLDETNTTEYTDEVDARLDAIMNNTPDTFVDKYITKKSTTAKILFYAKKAGAVFISQVRTIKYKEVTVACSPENKDGLIQTFKQTCWGVYGTNQPNVYTIKLLPSTK